LPAEARAAADAARDSAQKAADLGDRLGAVDEVHEIHWGPFTTIDLSRAELPPLPQFPSPPGRG